MTPSQGILCALIVVLVLLVLYRGRGMLASMKGASGCGCAAAGSKSGFSPVNPYTVIQSKVGEIIGNPDAQQIFESSDGRLARAARSGADVKPYQLDAAERQMWFAQRENSGKTGVFNTEDMFDVGADTMQAHKSAPAIDYNAYVTDMVADKRTRENHAAWVEGMSGFTATTMKVDDLHDEDYINFQGLARPQAGAGQYAPLMLTQIDDGMLARNKPFRFNG